MFVIEQLNVEIQFSKRLPNKWLDNSNDYFRLEQSLFFKIIMLESHKIVENYRY